MHLICHWPMPDSITAKQFKPVDYVTSSSIRQTGFIAQEVAIAAKAAGFDFNGLHVPENDNDNYSLSYDKFVVPLVKAVQEQQVIIEDQNKKITMLIKEVEEVKRRIGQ